MERVKGFEPSTFLNLNLHPHYKIKLYFSNKLILFLADGVYCLTKGADSVLRQLIKGRDI